MSRETGSGCWLQRMVRHQLRAFKIHKPKTVIIVAAITNTVNGTKSCQPVNCVPANTHVMCVVSGAFRQGKMHLTSKWTAAHANARANRKLKPLRKALNIKLLDVLLMPNDPSSATAATGRADGNRDGPPTFAAAHG